MPTSPYTISNTAAGYGTGMYAVNQSQDVPDVYYRHAYSAFQMEERGIVWKTTEDQAYLLTQDHVFQGPDFTYSGVSYIQDQAYKGVWVTVQLPKPMTIRRVTFAGTSDPPSYINDFLYTWTRVKSYRIYARSTADVQQQQQQQWTLIYANESARYLPVPGDASAYPRLYHDSGCFQSPRAYDVVAIVIRQVSDSGNRLTLSRVGIYSYNELPDYDATPVPTPATLSPTPAPFATPAAVLTPGPTPDPTPKPTLDPTSVPGFNCSRDVYSCYTPYIDDGTVVFGTTQCGFMKQGRMYPPQPLTGVSTNMTKETSKYGIGLYSVTSTSSDLFAPVGSYSDLGGVVNAGWNVFGDAGTPASVWSSGLFPGGVYSGSSYIQDPSYKGVWVSLRMPVPAVVTRVTWRIDTHVRTQSWPMRYRVYARLSSSSNCSWTLVHDASETDAIYSTSYKIYEVVPVHDSGCFNNTRFFDEYAIVVSRTSAQPLDTDSFFQLRHVRFIEYDWESRTTQNASNASSQCWAVLCSPGTYSDVEGGAITCSNCPPGTYSSMVGAASIAECRFCEVGTFASADGTSCIPCPAGTFSGAPGSTLCQACSRDGHFAGQQGSTACSLCQAGSSTSVTH